MVFFTVPSGARFFQRIKSRQTLKYEQCIWSAFNHLITFKCHAEREIFVLDGETFLVEPFKVNRNVVLMVSSAGILF